VAKYAASLHSKGNAGKENFGLERVWRVRRESLESTKRVWTVLRIRRERRFGEYKARELGGKERRDTRQMETAVV